MRLELRVWLRKKCYEISFHIGWFSGDPFKLFSLTLFEVDGLGGSIIFMLQIVKFSIYISADDVER